VIYNIKAVQSSLNLTQVWIKDLMETYDYADENKAFILLRATLKTLRDRITFDEAFHLASQLPAVIRGYYFEGWDHHKQPEDEKTHQDFLTSVKKNLGGHDDIDLEMAVPEALKIIFNHIDQTEAEDVMKNLPPDIHELLS
jgi:uncharacterized protein (DUF2267 family)